MKDGVDGSCSSGEHQEREREDKQAGPQGEIPQSNRKKGWRSFFIIIVVVVVGSIEDPGVSGSHPKYHGEMVMDSTVTVRGQTVMAPNAA